MLNDVVEHIQLHKLISAIQELKRVINVGGKICLEFPPWESPDASHLYDYINLPWSQLLFSDEILFNIVRSENQVKRLEN